ncbi:MAG TPA: hypothetical protein VFE62_27545 [Gemmataceae bacterium]|nr:hypothetical protein [Gemmataceae bacterium]
MNPVYKKTALAIFKRQLKQALPHFKQIRAGLPQSTVFCREHSKDLQVYVLVCWGSYEEKFNVRVGWTYRSTLDEMSSHFDPSTVLDFNAVIISLDALRGQPEVWHNLRDTRHVILDAEGMASVIASAIQELMSIGVPMLERVVSSKT